MSTKYFRYGLGINHPPAVLRDDGEKTERYDRNLKLWVPSNYETLHRYITLGESKLADLTKQEAEAILKIQINE